ncbi:vomeronasal type-2 receptor 26-like [Aquarana catesbeiana]|uniref:vomeronasal type-2 receptor 26-like n=1 Tax=Aquarana catesbeiana TaxID=8400 RepID=UPI003CC9A3E4
MSKYEDMNPPGKCDDHSKIVWLIVEAFTMNQMASHLVTKIKQAISCLATLYSCKSVTRNPSPACNLRIRDTLEDFDYFHTGDFIIGGVFTVNYNMVSLRADSIVTAIACFNPVSHYYKNLLAFLFGIEQMNKTPELQNISLGYHIYDSCADANKAVKSVLQILSGPGRIVPNYSCMKQNQIIGFIGDHHSRTTIPIAQVLSVYRYTQISYGSTSYELSNRDLYPHFFRTVQNYRTIYLIITNLIKRLGWTWVGVLASNDDSGEKEFQELNNFMASEGICVAFIIKIDHGLFKLHQFLKKLIYRREGNIHRFYNKDNEFVTYYIIKNWIILSNGSIVINCVGHFNPWKNDDYQFLINVKHIIWKHNKTEIPRSQCSETCMLGSRKMPLPGIQSFCCYACAPCSDGEMSNISDSEKCYTCSDLEWPNKMKNFCIPKLEEFLSYENETVTVVVISVTGLCCVITVLTLAVFIFFHHTPVVKANNKSLSFVLLASIFLGFLCVFLFLGQPVDLTCQLRQISFGILFTVAVSCVLAKTFLVCIAFKATTPGSVFRKLVGGSFPKSVVFLCTSIQVIICVSWLSISPPFQELDTHSYQEKIIIQCNEGSVIGFYSVLGYMGILAAVSFMTAFLARTLPDSFNEAKYITFSMLVFCIVWIAMIPAYLSTKGKYMVAVEIFAILVSNVGLLGCIFFPKCYIFVCRPKLDNRIHLLERKSAFGITIK